ncbi:AP5Z1 [Branchiostoma lanceolatum]|uniref:AP5Z1 protein n=1 Tax=Branchiostoma lanceolatum TaxID=7740 RepID=A0A8K0F0Q9_BRALA|nr:AP5Z1 [Branchiostoma lanceolatum]
MDNVGSVIERARSISNEELQEFYRGLQEALKSQSISDVIPSLRQLWLSLACTRYRGDVPPDLLLPLWQAVKEPHLGPVMVRVLCAAVLQELSPCQSVCLRGGELSSGPLSSSSLALTLPVVAGVGHYHPDQQVLREQLLTWLTGAGQVDTAAIAHVLGCLWGMDNSDVVTLTQEQVDGVSKQLCTWLTTTSTTQPPNPFSKNIFSSRQLVAVTEVDETPSHDMFTVLSVGQYYSPDQFLNMQVFSMMRGWLQKHQSKNGESAAMGLLVDKMCEYCLRLLDQCERKAVVQLDAELQQACLSEVILLLDTMCQQNSSMIPRVFPSIKRVYNRIQNNPTSSINIINILQFLLHHSDAVMYDMGPALNHFFTKILDKQCVDQSLAFEATLFCLENMENLCNNTSVLRKFFPCLLKVFAWQPKTLLAEFVDLLPTMVSEETAIEVLHCLLDLPVITAAMETVMRVEQRASLTLTDLSPEATAQTTPELAYTDPLHRPLFSFILRAEGGLGDTIDRLKVLHDILQDYSTLPRVVICSQAAPVLLRVYLQTVEQEASVDLLARLFPVLLERSSLLYPIKNFQTEVKRVLSEALVWVVQTAPGLLIDNRQEVQELMSSPRNFTGREDVFLHLAWAIGEYMSVTYDRRCTPDIISQYYEVVECLLYELSVSQLGRTETPLQDRARLTAVLMTALAKLATRCQDLMPRVLLCLTKITQQLPASGSQDPGDAVLLARAPVLINLCRMPNVAPLLSSLPAETDDNSKLHQDQNSSSCLLLQLTEAVMKQSQQ